MNLLKDLKPSHSDQIIWILRIRNQINRFKPEQRALFGAQGLPNQFQAHGCDHALPANRGSSYFHFADSAQA